MLAEHWPGYKNTSELTYGNKLTQFLNQPTLALAKWLLDITTKVLQHAIAENERFSRTSFADFCNKAMVQNGSSLPTDL